MEAVVRSNHSLFIRQELQDLVGSAAHEDTQLVCKDGVVLHNRLTVWLLYPGLRSCVAFLEQEHCSLILPDVAVKEVTLAFNTMFGSQREENGCQLGRLTTKETPKKNIDRIYLQNEAASLVNSEKLDLENFCEDILNNDDDLFYENNHNNDPPDIDQNNHCKIELIKVKEGRKRQKPEKGSTPPTRIKKCYEGEILPGSHPYKCTYCDKRFKQVGHANLHERTHTGDKKYMCKFCSKKFNQLSHQNDHERIHTGEKPFMCSDCGKCFAYNSALKSHKKIHTGEKTYRCGFCEKSFNQLGNLRTHERLHTGELKFMCTECGKCYNTRSNLGRHACNRSLHTSGGSSGPPPTGQLLQPQPHYLLHKLE